VREQSELKVHLISGHQPGMIKRALLKPDFAEGTTIRS
jgi:hypothetical protein